CPRLNELLYVIVGTSTIFANAVSEHVVVHVDVDVHVRKPLGACGFQHLVEVERESRLTVLNVGLHIFPHLHALDIARLCEARISADPLVSRPKLVRRMKDNGFVVMHVGMRQNHLLQEDDPADALIEFANKLLVPRWKPALALDLEKQARMLWSR